MPKPSLALKARQNHYEVKLKCHSLQLEYHLFYVLGSIYSKSTLDHTYSCQNQLRFNILTQKCVKGYWLAPVTPSWENIHVAIQTQIDAYLIFHLVVICLLMICRNIEEIMAEKGEEVKRVVSEGLLEIPGDTNRDTKK